MDLWNPLKMKDKGGKEMDSLSLCPENDSIFNPSPLGSNRRLSRFVATWHHDVGDIFVRGRPVWASSGP